MQRVPVLATTALGLYPDRCSRSLLPCWCFPRAMRRLPTFPRRASHTRPRSPCGHHKSSKFVKVSPSCVCVCGQFLRFMVTRPRFLSSSLAGARGGCTRGANRTSQLGEMGAVDDAKLQIETNNTSHHYLCRQQQYPAVCCCCWLLFFSFEQAPGEPPHAATKRHFCVYTGNEHGFCSLTTRYRHR